MSQNAQELLYFLPNRKPAMSASPSMTETSSNTRLGVCLMLLGMMMFALNDTLGKWMLATYSVGQVMLIRSLAALLVLMPFLMQSGAKTLVQVEKPRLQVLRVLFSTLEVFLFYIAVSYLPLADVMTYWLAAPIYVAAISPFLLGETVGWRRWTAIFIGFVGVIIALEPSSASFSIPALISIIGSMAFGFMMLLGRMLRGTPDKTLVFWQIMGAGVVSLVLSPMDWKPVSLENLLLLGLLGVVSMSAHMLINRALKLADASAVAPLQYTLLFWAVVFGWIAFGDVPRASMLLGAVFIVASGLFIFFREQQLKRQGKL